MITRNDYMQDSSNFHRQYYGQFVNEAVKAKVLKTWGLTKLLASKDEHLNDLPLAKWDLMGGFVFRGGECVMRPRSTQDIWPIDYALLKQAGEGLSSATTVCIYKEAARQIIEEHSDRRF